MNFGGIKLRIEPPAKFQGGQKDNYEDFEKRLRTYLGLSDAKYPKLLRWVVQQGMPITKDTMTAYLTAERATQEQMDMVHQQLNPFLYYTLVSVTEGPAYTIIEQVEEENGYEAYRQMNIRYAKTKMQTAIMRMAAIINIKFHDSTFENSFAEWEGEIHKLETALRPRTVTPDTPSDAGKLSLIHI